MSGALEEYKGIFSDREYLGTPIRKYEDIEEPLSIDPYRGDEIKIGHSKAFRRLALKTQVFPRSQNPHVRTRISHTEEVTGIAGVISDFLGLNVGLSQAIARGHDIGHGPFGHYAEKTITELSREQYGEERRFLHQIFGVVVAQRIERPHGRGLNLTYQTLDGIASHYMTITEQEERKKPLEYAVLIYADKLAYTFADVNDAERMGRIKKGQVQQFFDFKRKNQRELTMECIEGLLRESAEYRTIRFEETDAARRFAELRRYMYKNVYDYIDWTIQDTMLRRINAFFAQDRRFIGVDPLLMLALLTDTQAYELGDAICKNKKIGNELLFDTGITEMKSYIKGREIDYSDPELEIELFVH